MPGPLPLVQPPTTQPDRSRAPGAAPAHAPASRATAGLRAVGGYAAQAASLVPPEQVAPTAVKPSPESMDRLDRIQNAFREPQSPGPVQLKPRNPCPYANGDSEMKTSGHPGGDIDLQNPGTTAAPETRKPADVDASPAADSRPAEDHGERADAGRCVTPAELAAVEARLAAVEARSIERDEALNILSTAGNLTAVIYTSQVSAVGEVRTEAEKGEKPGFLQSLMEGLLDTLLAAGLGGIMGKIAASIVTKATASIASKGLEKAAQTAAIDSAKAYADGVKDAGKQAAKSTARMVLGAMPGNTPSPAAFFEPLAQGLAEGAVAAQIEQEGKRTNALAAVDPVPAAKAVREAVRESATVAKGLQYDLALDGWATYLARQDQGITGEGGTNLFNDYGHGADAGLLYVQVQLGKPGAAVSVLDAGIDGLDDTLVKRIASRPLGSLKIPMVVEGELPLPYTEYRGSDVDVALNEQRLAWVETYDDGPLLWLHHRAGGQHDSFSPEARRAMELTAKAGAYRLIEEDMAHLVLGEKLS